jgi:hypothetical protein
MNPTIAVPTDSTAQIKNAETPDAFKGPIAHEYGTTAKLFDEIRDFLAQHPGLTTDAVLKLTYFSFALLFPEHAGIWPFASVVAPDTVGSSLLLRMLACVCVAPLHIGEVTLNAILTLPSLPCPSTLLIDQLAPNKELERVLRLMSRPAGRILRKGQLYEISLPTLVCTAAPLRDRWILDQAIQVVLAPVRGPLPKFDSQSLDDSARKLRGKLARYRELNLAKVRASRFDAPHFSSPTRAIACMLGNSIVDDPSLQRCLLMILGPQDEDARVRRTDSIEAVAAEAALFLTHERARQQARVGEITTIANGILKGRGESLELDPREVGNQLRALGLFSKRLGGAGRGIRFTKDVRRQIHGLAQAYDVRTLDNSTCEFCAEVVPRNGDKPRHEN